MNEKIEEIGGPISEEDLKSREIVNHTRTHIQEIKDINGLNLNEEDDEEDIKGIIIEKPQ